MEKISLNAYLMFEGNCREALTFYQNVFGGDLNLMTYGDMDASCPAATKDNIMHGQLMGCESELMAADYPEESPLGVGRINLALSGTDEPKLRKMYEGLSEGGKIQVPLEKQVWGDLYGAFTDKYSISWMVNIGQAKPE